MALSFFFLVNCEFMGGREMQMTGQFFLIKLSPLKVMVNSIETLSGLSLRSSEQYIFVVCFQSLHVEVLKCWTWILKHSRSPHRVPHLIRQQDSVWSLWYGFQGVILPSFWWKVGPKISGVKIWILRFGTVGLKNNPWVQSNMFVGISTLETWP